MGKQKEDPPEPPLPKQRNDILTVLPLVRLIPHRYFTCLIARIAFVHIQLRPKVEERKYPILSQSAGSWFLEHKRVYISEDAIRVRLPLTLCSHVSLTPPSTTQAAAEAAEVVAHHRLQLPPIDLASLDLASCRAAIRKRDEVVLQESQRAASPKKGKAALEVSGA